MCARVSVESVRECVCVCVCVCVPRVCVVRAVRECESVC